MIMAEHSKAKSTKPRHKNWDIAEKHFLLDVLPESIDVLEKKRKTTFKRTPRKHRNGRESMNVSDGVTETQEI